MSEPKPKRRTMTTEQARALAAKRVPQHSPAEIETALTVLAHLGGNSARASELTGIPSSTLRVWRLYDHVERYAEIMKREAPRIEALAIAQSRELTLKYAALEHAAVERVMDVLPEMDGKDASNAMKNAAISRGVSIDKTLVLEGRPTSIQGHLTGDDSIKSLAQRFPWLVVEGTAHDVQTAKEQRSVPLITQADEPNAHEPE